MAAPVWVAFLAVLVVWYFFWRRRKLSVFKTIGIPGPAPSFFTGNMSEILKKGSVVTFTEWIKQYGDLVGFFNGGTPVLIVKNVDLLKKIQIKDFGNFTCRGVVSAVSKNHNLSRRALTNVPGERWKEVRSLLKPAFKASNMKQVVALQQSCIEELMSVIATKTNSGQSVDMRRIFQNLSFDVITRAAFGARTNIQTSPRGSEGDVLMTAALDSLRQFNTGWLTYIARAEQSTKINRKRRMTTEEIQANASTFLIAGFETTGTTLAFSAYLLAKHPEIQDKTRDEVRSIIEKENGLTYDGVFSMRLLDQVISEVLRLYPPVVGFITRRCENDYEYEGLKIPKDITVVVPAYQLHHDPVYWENPEEFDPERFSPENKDKIEPMAYQPFGNGPRNCVAMRFGQLTLKMTLAKLLSKYKFTLDEERHQNGLKIGSSFTLAYPEGGVWIYINEL
ncbi:hypothetical protein HPB47_022744 [Ixodes persulcatus]|uniref:Uncharacterized protein n=1 Tax=Ixodes persulcatus TaxID=34615 RepID=A0AC60Q9B3_IXOPE|nr:hypothetical protein HPB47_022744 [Ixodes persulcatus]